MTDVPLIQLTIKNRQKILYEGIAKHITSTNEKGVFDILPFHANFITLVRDYILIDKGLNTQQQLPIEKGFLIVMSNKVEVFVGI